MANRARRRSGGLAADKSDELVELSSRLVYSLLRSAVRLAARFDMPMDRLTQLAQLAYFEELRSGAPRDLSRVAKRLGLSLRSVSTLNRKLKGDFFKPEKEIEPLRAMTAALLSGSKTRAELLAAVDDVDEDVLDRCLRLLEENAWIRQSGDRFVLERGIRSFVDDTFQRRIDGLNNQLEILVRSVSSRFLERDDQTAAARSWTFAARPSDIEAFIERTMKHLRHEAIDVEESALSDGAYDRYGVTIAVAPMKDKKP